MSYGLITGPPGTGLRYAVATLAATYPQDSLEVHDVEDCLCSELMPECWQSYGLAPRSTWSMEHVTRELPRQVVVDLWENALTRVKERIESTNPTHTLISFHSTLYSYRRGELYSPVDASLFPSRLGQPRIVVLIDDIFDMFSRLSRRGHLFDCEGAEGYIGTYEKRFIRQALTGTSGPDTEESLSAVLNSHQSDLTVAQSELRAQMRFEARIDVLRQLLEWRKADMVLAERLALELRGGVLAIGAKQFAHVIGRWLRCDADSTYLSHPISRPRKMLAQEPSSGWHSVVDSFNRLQQEFANRDCLAVMPTAIDELRFSKASDSLPPAMQPSLSDRWPIPRIEDTLFEPSPFTAIESDGSVVESQSSVFGVGLALSSDSASAQMRMMESSVRAQIPFRDHYLVAHAPHLTVFRPLFAEGGFSGGVIDEIRHWTTAARVEGSRRAIFIHYEVDIEPLWAGIMESQAWPEFERRVIDHISSYLRNEEWPEDQVGELLRSRDELLDAGTFSDAYRRATLRSAVEAAVDKSLFFELTQVSLPREELVERIYICIVPDNSALEANYGNIVSFLRGVAEAPSWEQVYVASGALGPRRQELIENVAYRLGVEES